MLRKQLTTIRRFACWQLKSQHIIHAVFSRRFAGQKLSGEKSAAGVAIAGVGAMGQFQGFSECAKDDGMLADVVADADGMDADFARRSFANQSFAAVAQLALAHGLLHDASELESGAARRIFLESMMALENLHIKALIA